VARDPYKYFRVEARELVDALARAALEIEKGSGGNEPVAQMLRLAHTLKGASRVVKQPAIADVAHAIEDLLAPHRDQSAAAPPALAEPVLRMLDAITSRLSALEPEAPPAAEKAAPATPETLRSVRVEIAEMDALLEGISEAALRLAELRRELDDLARALQIAAALFDQLPATHRGRASAEELRALVARIERNLGSGVDRLDSELDQTRDRARDLRLLPASVVFPILERAARDAAHSLDRSIVFAATGGECRLEANVLFALRDGLLHVVRNAVAHGIEAEAERRRLGKPPAGRIALRVERRGNRVAFVCSDDGRGIDPDSVRRAAVARGVITSAKAEALGPEDILRLVLESGVTTTETVTEVSGRGVGLDVLRATVEELKGDVKLTSDPGRGTTVDLCVPVSISSIAALVLGMNGSTFAMPLDAVQRSMRLSSRDVARFGDRDSVVVDGVVVPFLSLAGFVGGGDGRDRGDRSWSAIVIASGAQTAVIGADRLVGTSSIVLRPLPKAAGFISIAAGVSLDADGNPQLVLDPRGLIALAHGAQVMTRDAAAAEVRPPILIVDDSLTTRMLEQSILESAGYAVEVATSGEEGLIRARERAPSLFLVDVEMPGIDGFEFVTRTRADPLLRAVPAIMVSSCDSIDDRRRAEEAGARAYIVKGEFDQGQFLRTIRQLIG
jgi:two-component system chemotaxis sensor kinase CheA